MITAKTRITDILGIVNGAKEKFRVAKEAFDNALHARDARMREAVQVIETAIQSDTAITGNLTLDAFVLYLISSKGILLTDTDTDQLIIQGRHTIESFETEDRFTAICLTFETKPFRADRHAATKIERVVIVGRSSGNKLKLHTKSAGVSGIQQVCDGIIAPFKDMVVVEENKFHKPDYKVYDPETGFEITDFGYGIYFPLAVFQKQTFGSSHGSITGSRTITGIQIIDHVKLSMMLRDPGQGVVDGPSFALLNIARDEFAKHKVYIVPQTL